MGRQAKAGWRKDFLKALARTGNARWAARRAGVDKQTAYTLRQRDWGFAREWRWAKLFADGRLRGDGGGNGRFEMCWIRHRPHARDEGGCHRGPPAVPKNTPPPARAWSCSGADGPRPFPAHPADGRPEHSPSREGEAREAPLVVRFNKREGAQLVRAGAGRWSNLTEARFTSALEATSNVRAAAAAAGVSTTALYNRRKRYPLLEAHWAAARETGCRTVSLMLIDAAEAALDPELDAAALGLPSLSVRDAIAILRLHRFDEPGAPTHAGARAAARARGQAVEDMPLETVREEILRRVDAIRAHEARRAEREAGETGEAPASPSPSTDEGGEGVESTAAGDSPETPPLPCPSPSRGGEEAGEASPSRGGEEAGEASPSRGGEEAGEASPTRGGEAPGESP